MTDEIKLTAMPTPNPNSIKFLVDKQFLEKGSINFITKEEAKNSVLPEALMELEGIEGVMIGTNFISITKNDNAGWQHVLEPASDIIKSKLMGEDPLFDASLIKEAETVAENDDETVTKIKTILDNEIRPAIAMDGGDCEFIGYEDGILSLRMQGACSNCPSSVMTLKMGIENRLKEEIPDLKEVIQL